jgi:hypothetical protein
MISKPEKKDFLTISNFRDKNEKASWLRKKKNLEALVAECEPIDSQLLKLNAEKLALIDQIQAIRRTMIVDCIHPKDYLVHYGSYVKCRFCESSIAIARQS